MLLKLVRSEYERCIFTNLLFVDGPHCTAHQADKASHALTIAESPPVLQSMPKEEYSSENKEIACRDHNYPRYTHPLVLSQNEPEVAIVVVTSVHEKVRSIVGGHTEEDKPGRPRDAHKHNQQQARYQKPPGKSGLVHQIGALACHLPVPKVAATSEPLFASGIFDQQGFDMVTSRPFADLTWHHDHVGGMRKCGDRRVIRRNSAKRFVVQVNFKK